MFDQVRADAAAAADWPDLVDELDRWGEAGRVAALWWRDDDAVAMTARLAELLRLAGDVPLALAVIPALARADLADALAAAPRAAVLQHGWRHANRAATGKKSEYPEGRPAALVAAELGAGQARLKAMFGPRALPVFVPPWNRIAGGVLPLLPRVGIRRVSTMAPSRTAPATPTGLATLDVHLDVVHWRGGRGFIGMPAALAGLVGCLRGARCGEVSGPIGVLTHHLVMDCASGEFLGGLAALIREHQAASWVAVGEVLR